MKNCTDQYIINIKCDLASDEYNVSLITALSIILANQVLDEAAIPYKSRTMIVELLETYYIDQLVYHHSRIMREQALASIALKIADEDTYYREGLLNVLTMLDNLLVDKASYNADKYREYNLYKKLCWFVDNINEPKNLKLELLNSLRFSIANMSMTGE